METCLVFCLWRHLLQYYHLQQLNLIFTKFLSSVKLLNMIRGTFLQSIFLISCLISDLWHHLWHHCATFHLFHNFIAVLGNFDFMKWLSWCRLLGMTREIFWQNVFDFFEPIHGCLRCLFPTQLWFNLSWFGGEYLHPSH